MWPAPIRPMVLTPEIVMPGPTPLGRHLFRRVRPPGRAPTSWRQRSDGDGPAQHAAGGGVLEVEPATPLLGPSAQVGRAVPRRTGLDAVVGDRRGQLAAVGA